MENQSGQTMMIPSMNYYEELKNELKNDIKEIKDLLVGKKKLDAGDVWLESQEARKMLKVSPATWQAYRDKGIIPFSQLGRKIFVRKADIDSFLKEHYIKKSVNNE